MQALQYQQEQQEFDHHRASLHEQHLEEIHQYLIEAQQRHIEHRAQTQAEQQIILEQQQENNAQPQEVHQYHLNLSQQIHDDNLAIQHNHHALAQNQVMQQLPLGRRPYQEPDARYSVGHMDVECSHCKALHFSSKKLSFSTRNHIRFGMCCLQGQIRLPVLLDPPQTLRNLLCGDTENAKSFRLNIRQYNSAFAFTSIAAKLSDHVTTTSGPYAFKIHGELYHQMGTLLPPNHLRPSYAQLYVIDPQAALNERNNANPNLKSEIMNNLQDMFHEHNPYLKHFSHLYPHYSPLHYVTLFPHGEQGFHPNILAHPGPDGQMLSSKVSQRCYYAYCLMHRLLDPETIFRAGKLFQQYVVDAWASIESSNLFWIRNHQKEIRAEKYQSLFDAIHAEAEVDLGQRGKCIVLPSTHAGSPRYMYQLFQDSMAITRHCHKPDIFITMTVNPNWPEITEQLLKYDGGSTQQPFDRPDLVARVFALKMKALIKDIKEGLFGKVAGMVYTIEF
ncbi:hypothetical protein HETIRDRAFT_307199 [Heterobasidion irregulare TC 32-1]|uniref:Helitron helicase-like domain-containing protein n=1 Tax=Heterobasidion irregulare (strain TC 32-1) TaxID=747525 RepID=W4KL26_HETIT|nr:uncharacterized protein HETIRDRAFT_307199 [Heterobasidion irregulare TC 32-1]ETW86527.1 hypothetical protein HETIRDRAFT_307199 [Heterobasidion irregulare TC 32-1]